MEIILDRSNLLRQIQQQYDELSELTATLDLMKLRTFPTLDAPPHIHHVQKSEK